MKRLLIAFSACAWLALSAAPSQALTATSAEFDACHVDAARLCGPLGDGIFAKARVFACMLTKLGQLSPKCRGVFHTHGL